MIQLTQHHWQAHVKALKQSGLSRAEYCRQYNLSYHALTYWSRKLPSPGSTSSTLVPVPLVTNIRRNAVLTAESAALKIVLPGKMSIEVSDNFSSVTLTRLLATLDRR